MINSHDKFVNFLNDLLTDENKELCDIIMKVYQLLYPNDTPIKLKKYTEYEGDSSFPSDVTCAFESVDKFEVKHIDGKKPVKTTIAPKDRTLNNIPKFTTGKNKVNFRDWLEIKSKSGVGKGCDGKWYGWSHRAVYGFGIGDKVKKGDIAYKGKEFTIMNDEQAHDVAKRFSDGVS